MSMMPESAYPSARCNTYVEGGTASYPCLLPLGHRGPCAPIEVQSARDKRERWLKENPEEAAMPVEQDEPVDPNAPDPDSPFIEDQPDPVVVANTPAPKPKSLPGADAMLRHVEDDAMAARHAVIAIEEIVDALREVFHEEADDDPVACVQKLVAWRQGHANAIEG